ncbi:MAG TPA: hypothetical protein VFY51_07400 [Pyrinomonadaceae bacterium]|nr:hypothetical protein [Pyrinomonadaceae bacterium]
MMSREVELNQPPLQRDSAGHVDVDSVPDVIDWFLNNDQRVAVIKHPSVEEVFHWKQQQSQLQGEEVFIFNHAEDRLAIGIIQALADNATERDLHAWISQLLMALDTASKANESTAEAYQLDLRSGGSIVKQSEKIPFQRGRSEFLLNCWIETLCTAEARVLGWLYKEFYGKPYAP